MSLQTRCLIGQFKLTIIGFSIPVTDQKAPGSQKELPIPAINDETPTADGGSEPYKAAGKLKGKKVIITGGDSGIGRAVAILFAMEGAESFIVYLEVEEKDAQETKKLVEEKGGKCHLLATDLKKKENCQKVISTALEKMGSINILINNAAFQNMIEDIKDLSE